MKRKLIVMILLLIIVINLNLIFLVNAEIQTLGRFRQDSCITLKQICGNCSYNNISSISYPNSSIVLINLSMTKSGTAYNYTFCNTTALGEYTVNGFGDINGEVSVWAYNFFITPNGEENTIANSLFYLGSIIIIIILVIGSAYTFVKGNSLWVKGLGFGLGYIFLVIFSYLAWVGSENYFYSISFLVDFFRWSFLILLFLVIPLLFGMFVYLIYLSITIPEMKRMLKHGVVEDDAVMRQERRRKRRWGGKRW